MSNNIETTRFTATLPIEYIEELKEMAKEKKIPSINFAFIKAIEAYLDEIKKEKYNLLMKEASEDKEFLERNTKCEEDFSDVDREGMDEW